MTLGLRDLPQVSRILVRTYGWKGIVRRGLYEAQLRSGHLERALPVQGTLEPAEPGWSWPLRFDLDRLRRGYEQLDGLDGIRDQVVAETQRLLGGEIRFYGWAWKPVGWPPRWHVNPWTGHEYPRTHWSRISDDQPDNGDIKDVWEMSRWPFTYLLTRAWVLTSDDRYPEQWWRAVEDWVEHNLPNAGVNWRCGQETSLRGIALQFGLMTFGDHPATSRDRLRLAGGLLRASVHRVLPTLRYALSQRNNHAISEAVFLETAAVGGAASPAVARSARRALREALADQFYADGWYAQHSFNYQRLALHTLLWLNRVRAVAGLLAEPRSVEVIQRSAALLGEAQDPRSGRMPNVGPNDGALLFPLTTAAHPDFRPVLATLPGGAAPAYGRWPASVREEAVWLGDEAVSSMTRGARAPSSHFAVLDGPRSHIVARTGVSRHRRNHDDLLHLDVWVDGQNVLADAGTYRYTAPAPWDNALVHRRVHNVSFLEGVDHDRVGRFLRRSWPGSETVRHDTPAAGVEVVVLRRVDAESELVRTIVRSSDVYLVTDYAGGEPFATRWTFGVVAEVTPTPAGVEVTAGPARESFLGDVSVLTADEAEPATAWISRNYAQREPTTALLVRSPGDPLVALLGATDGPLPEVDLQPIIAGDRPPESWLPPPAIAGL